MRIREFEIEDWDNIKNVVEPFTLCDVPKEIINMGWGITAIEDGEILGCGGVLLTGENEGSIWVMLSKEAAKKPVRAMLVIRDCLRIIRKSFELDTMVSYVLQKFKKGKRMAEYFGFYPTGQTIKYRGRKYNVVKYDPDKDRTR